MITDRLKDLLVTAGGKKVAPQPIEARLKTQPAGSAEAVLLGDRRPYVIALLVPNFAQLEAEAQARGWASPHARAGRAPRRPGPLPARDRSVEPGPGPFEQIKNFALLEGELTQEAGELTPTLKVRRRVVADRHAKEIEALYAGPTMATVTGR